MFPVEITRMMLLRLFVETRLARLRVLYQRLVHLPLDVAQLRRLLLDDEERIRRLERDGAGYLVRIEQLEQALRALPSPGLPNP